MKKIIFLGSLLFCSNVIACTSFGFITESGTVIAKNRDYIYSPQNLEVLMPNKEFFKWYDNKYSNTFKVLALLSNNDVKMAVNEKGLTAIEEDPPFPKNAQSHRKFLQPINGNAEGMVLWGVAQNFASVDQIIPSIKNIFEYAAPNYYEFSDAHKILIIEVSYGISDFSKTRKFSYKIISKKSQQFAHTNYYKDNNFNSLNNMLKDKYSLKGTINRDKRIKELLKRINKDNVEEVINVFMDTKSKDIKPGDKNWCQNTSIFRSYIQNESFINTDNINKVYGTVSSMIVFNHGKPENTIINFKIIDRINTTGDGSQEIIYHEINDNLYSLFNNKYSYQKHKFIRSAPKNDLCE